MRGGMWVKGEKERGGGRKGGGRSIEGEVTDIHALRGQNMLMDDKNLKCVYIARDTIICIMF